ncbi:MAG: phosphohistidine phosphatase SixA [Leptolyngbyaceae cyanobacterium bins.59]|nr:phosphohistidine phosphatase SixA [Leptolyngbyaceae cyanobacterium bins.59]
MAELYIIRHGLAADRGSWANDKERPLTEEGDRKTRQVAQRLREFKVSFETVLTSPLVRALQTAAILSETQLVGRLEVSDWLAPGGDREAWLQWLEGWRQSGETRLAIVGHEPDLSEWAEGLIWGEVRGVITLKKAGILGLCLPESGPLLGNCQLFWLTPPRFVI